MVCMSEWQKLPQGPLAAPCCFHFDLLVWYFRSLGILPDLENVDVSMGESDPSCLSYIPECSFNNKLICSECADWLPKYVVGQHYIRAKVKLFVLLDFPVFLFVDGLSGPLLYKHNSLIKMRRPKAKALSYTLVLQM